MKEEYRNRIRGCLAGGAAGDALGYAVEFDRLSAIRSRYGFPGITGYELDPVSGKALISDDTQMTLFTAEGIMNAMEAGVREPGSRKLYKYVHNAYLDWFSTQGRVPVKRPLTDAKPCSLLEVPQLHASRAPGLTCLGALSDPRGRDLYDPVNNSKGCGGIMRVAPAGILYPDAPPEQVVEMGAEMSAITHGHPLGCFPSGIFSAIIQQAVYDEEDTPLAVMTERAVEAARSLYGQSDLWEELEQLIDRAVSCAGNDMDDDRNIRELGEGWVAEETLAVALYCALRYENDFSAGITAAVNHDGDSDSTGAVTGNILGALHGYDAIGNEWKEDLEILDVILDMADACCEAAG